MNHFNSLIRLQYRFAGHSHFHNIQHKKAANDSKRAVTYAKLSNEIQAAIRAGGGDVTEANVRLQSVLSKARAMNMPKDRIDAALSSKKDAGVVEEILYEAKGPSNTALLIEALTDNRKRTAPQIRAILSKYGGTLLNPGSLARMFQKIGVVAVTLGGASGSEEEVMEKVMQVDGVESFEAVDAERAELVCQPGDLKAVTDGLKRVGCSFTTFETTYLPAEFVAIDREQKNDKGLTHLDVYQKMLDEFDEHPEVQRVISNYDHQ